MIQKGKKPFGVKFVKNNEPGKNDQVIPVYCTLYERPEPISTYWLNCSANRDRSNSKISKAYDLVIFFEWYEEKIGSFSKNIISLSSLPIFLADSLLERISKPVTRSGCLSPSTIKRRSSTIAQFLRYSYSQVVSSSSKNEKARKCLDDLEVFIKIICKDTYYRKEESTNRASHEDVSMVISAMLRQLDSEKNTDSYVRQLRNTLIIWLISETGMRRSELCMLTLDCIDIDSARPCITVKVKPPQEVSPRRQIASIKTRGRTLPISQKLADFISNYIDNCRVLIREKSTTRWSSYLFLSMRDGAPLGPSSVYVIVSNAFKEHAKSGIVVSPHDLRTYCISKIRDQLINDSTTDNFWLGKDIVSYVGGWSPVGEMADYYTNMVVREKLNHLAARIYKEWKW
ncbi:site-specific integrase [Alcanivorax sp. 1008]|uniref:tyrosine-type recombinase/integrase n=1 Tax=Alcanivorax sp. 1008 TaxID=2816853 RepID=UPI001D8C8995|nr:site-specific integrase [Alcanivorax sp. 1008]MCC1498094.1 site-specific integrase [Alcanivorax sp. 1008]